MPAAAWRSSPGSSSNTIGGSSAADRNVISGNAGNGVNISDSGTQYNVVENDFIGTDATGRFAVPNGSDGVIVQSAASVNALSYDVISGNAAEGVLFTGSGTNYNYVIDSKIGLNAAGTAALIDPQTGYGNIVGVEIAYGASGTSVDFNTISGNVVGVEILGSSTNNGVYDNLIGTDATGQHAVGNGAFGVLLELTSGNSVAYNTIDFSGEYGLFYYYSSPGQDYGNGYSGDAYGSVITFG